MRLCQRHLNVIYFIQSLLNCHWERVRRGKSDDSDRSRSQEDIIMDNSYIDMSRDSAIMGRSEICNAMLNSDMYKSRESLMRNKSMNKGETKHAGGRRRNSAVSRRKSTKRSFRHPSFGVGSKVKRNIGMSKKQRNMEHSITNRNNEVREERSKSFIVKRRSFRKPRKWSSYIKNSVEEGDHLPRVKGFWRNQKFVSSRLSSLGKIWTEQLKRRTETSKFKHTNNTKTYTGQEEVIKSE